jgi:hypothetical protein
VMGVGELSSLVMEVTDFPLTPQGTMCLNQLRSVSQLTDTPCVVT